MKFLDPGLRRDDDFEVSSTNNVIPAQAGIQCRDSGRDDNFEIRRPNNVIPAQAGTHGLDSSGVRPSQK